MAAVRAGNAIRPCERTRSVRHFAELVMELEAEEFEDIVRGLGERPPGINATRAGERLTAKDGAARVRLNLQGLVKPAGADRAAPMTYVTVKDISLAGEVSIVHPTILRDGEQFVLQVPRTAGKPLTLPCT